MAYAGSLEPTDTGDIGSMAISREELPERLSDPVCTTCVAGIQKLRGKGG